MKLRIDISTAKWLIRSFLLVLALLPFIFWQPFYSHFYAYLTGTIISNIITSQWHIALLSILLFGLFLIPLNYRRRAKWLDYGLAGAFFVSLFIEMYGIPLTILFASKYLFAAGTVLPDNLINFNLFGVSMGMDHAMAYGALLMSLGMALIIFGWRSLYRQTKYGGFASTGLYSLSRHPQYLGFILVIIGWLFGWPTVLTLAFSPILIYKYIKAARSEENDAADAFGSAYLDYAARTPFLV